VVALLMPAKIVNAAYAGPLRRAARSRVIALDDWSDSTRDAHCSTPTRFRLPRSSRA
jgi:hypothetical protein